MDSSRDMGFELALGPEDIMEQWLNWGQVQLQELLQMLGLQAMPVLKDGLEP